MFFRLFECSGQMLWLWFMSILKRQVDSSPNLVSLFSFMKDYSSVLFSSNNTYFAQKESIKVNMFETSECSGQILLNSLCQFWNKSIPLQIPSKFCVSLQFHERYVLYTFLAQTIYTLLKRSPLKWKFLRISSSAQVNICQIFYVNFETTSWFLPKFCIPLQFHERLFLCTF